MIQTKSNVPELRKPKRKVLFKPDSVTELSEQQKAEIDVTLYGGDLVMESLNELFSDASLLHRKEDSEPPKNHGHVMRTPRPSDERFILSKLQSDILDEDVYGGRDIVVTLYDIFDYNHMQEVQRYQALSPPPPVPVKEAIKPQKERAAIPHCECVYPTGRGSHCSDEPYAPIAAAAAVEILPNKIDTQHADFLNDTDEDGKQIEEGLVLTRHMQIGHDKDSPRMENDGQRVNHEGEEIDGGYHNVNNAEERPPLNVAAAAEDVIDEEEASDSAVQAKKKGSNRKQLENPEIPEISRQYFDTFLVPADANKGQRSCLKGATCVGYQIGSDETDVFSYVTQGDKKPLREFLFPSEIRNLDGSVLYTDNETPNKNRGMCVVCMLNSTAYHVGLHMYKKQEPKDLLQRFKVNVRNAGEFCAEECWPVSIHVVMTGVPYPFPKFDTAKFRWTKDTDGTIRLRNLFQVRPAVY